ncbi:MAG TPA: aminotransferase class V-fold PLP-dependent enzyme [Candidatus Eisenbacteria bacterium]|nr:aminotransferase class V-fold PLP-dependent enzyme [Candidatus Eisenbacteria bacterium]
MTPSPAFGHALRGEWPLDPDLTYLNHGTVGVTPRRVLAVQRDLRETMERNPSSFMLRELTGDKPAPWRPGPTRMREAAAAVASFVGVRGEDFVFTPNVTHAINAVLRSFPFEEGDEILVTDTAYGAIVHGARNRAREFGGQVVVAEMPYPTTPAAARDAILAAAGPKTRLAIVDHISSESAQLLPLAEITAALHERGVLVLADGAHAPGAIALDVPATGVDWYAANLHKWCHAPRSCGFLWTLPERQAGLHPWAISWGWDQGFAKEFDWVGTLDPTNYLSAPEGVAMLREWGFEAVCGYMHRLAWDGARLLTEAWGTVLGQPEEMVGSMVTVPLPERAGDSMAQAAPLRLALLLDEKIEVQMHAYRGRLWVRISAQVYNDLSDVERLAKAVLRRI